MENGTGARSFNGQFVQSRRFIRVKEKPFRSKNYLDFLAHYDAELVQIDGPIMVADVKPALNCLWSRKANYKW